MLVGYTGVGTQRVEDRKLEQASKSTKGFIHVLTSSSKCQSILCATCTWAVLGLRISKISTLHLESSKTVPKRCNAIDKGGREKLPASF